MQISEEEFHYWLIIELSYFSPSAAAQLAKRIEVITADLLGSQEGRWRIGAARKDMSIEVHHRSDLLNLCKCLDDLGFGHLFTFEDLHSIDDFESTDDDCVQIQAALLGTTQAS